MDRGRCVVASQREIFRLDSYAKVSIFLVMGQNTHQKAREIQPIVSRPLRIESTVEENETKARVSLASRAFVACIRHVPQKSPLRSLRVIFDTFCYNIR